MKRLVLLAAISFALCMNAFGQIHKAFGDKPLFSHHYTFADNNDSVADFKTIYTYNAINQLTKSISFPFITDERINVDSTVRIYDANDRIISSTSYSYGAAYYSEQWIYDTLNKEINCYSYFYSEGGAKDSIFHIFYQGVHDFDNVPSSIISASIFELFSGFVIDCDSVFIKAPNQTTSLLETMYTVYPVYQNGKIISSKTVMKSFDISILLPGMSLVVDLTVDYLYTYSGDKLMNMNGNITIVPVLLPVPVTLSDAITTINQYDNNDLLIESTSAIDVNLMGTVIYDGTKQKYAYNADNNISVIIEEKSEEGTSWTVSEKTYYFYNEDNVDDIALISTGEPNPRPDIVGESINLKVLLENKNYLNVYQNVNITALIEDTQGNQIATFTETIDQIYLGVSMLYTFPQNYTVPNDSVYFITVYIDSYDNNKLNDTLHLKRLTHNEVADIELISIETPSATTKGVIGESINVKVLLENKSILNVYRNVYIRVLIEGAQGNQITTFSEIIGQINVGVSMRYTFSQDYIVPNDSVYYITVYIDSYDNNKLNDTLHLTHYTTPLNDIKTIDNSTVHISQNFPNPADNQTLITYSIPTAGQATFSVYSINGQLLSSQSVKANTGENTLVLNTDKLAAGIYFYAFEFNGQRIVKKMNVSR